jgi:polysaccharide biosynthesis protein PslG
LPGHNPLRSSRRVLAVISALALLSVSLVFATSAAGGADARRSAAKPAALASAKAQAARRAVFNRVRKAVARRAKPPRRPTPQTGGSGGGDAGSTPPPPTDQPRPGAPVGSADRFGVSPDNIEFEEPEIRDRLLDSMVAAGARWIRFDVKWEVIQHHGPAGYDFERYDELVAAARARGLQVLGTLAYAPRWARSPACPDEFMCEPRSADEYATWAARTVVHFAGRISHWELWNEPNIAGFWKPRPNPGLYTALIRAAYPRIKAASPQAFVLAGATSPAPNDATQVDEVTFLQQVYANGGAGHFDAWSHHPYTHPGPPGHVHPHSAWYQMYGAKPSIRSLMTANGDGGKRLWGTEFGPPSAGAAHYSEAHQAQHVADAYRLWRSYDWAGPLFWYSMRDTAEAAHNPYWRFHGLLRRNLTPKPSWHAYRAAATA